ncbi:MAG: hypothetical protein EOR05_20115 [Mesorhizobium sp.]|nr:MAG: hypothetical protein EOR05_20115 [Mesorhizobium sp.]
MRQLAAAVVAAVERGCDAILVDLHGAMVTRSFDGGEGELLARLRRAAADVPLGVALDLHDTSRSAWCTIATACSVFKTYPSFDMSTTGEPF